MTDKEPTMPTKTGTTDTTTKSNDYDKVVSPDSRNVVSPDSRSPEFRCDICGKSLPSSGSLVGHKIKVHKIAPKKKVASREGGKEKERKFTPLEPEVTDSLTQLRDTLIRYGLDKKDARAVISSMENYDVDDVLALDRQLRSVNMPNNRRTMFFEAWIKKRNIVIDSSTARKIGIPLQERESPYPDEKSSRRITMTDISMMEYLDQKREYYEAKTAAIKTPPTNDNSPMVAMYQEKDREIAERDRKLEEERERRHQAELKRLEDLITGKQTTQYDAFIVAVEKLSDKVGGFGEAAKELAVSLKPVVRMVGFQTLKNYSEQTGTPIPVVEENLPKREKVEGEDSDIIKILEKSNKELLVES